MGCQWRKIETLWRVCFSTAFSSTCEQLAHRKANIAATQESTEETLLWLIYTSAIDVVVDRIKMGAELKELGVLKGTKPTIRRTAC